MAANIDILYEDNHLLIINKPSGLPSQGDLTEDACAIDVAKDYIKHAYNKPGKVFCGLVHRLDRPTSGCLMLCKTSKALSRMSEQFKKREIKKCYLAIVDRPVADDKMRLENHLYKNRKKNHARVVPANHRDAKHALLEFERVMTFRGQSLLKVFPHTGRSHQIRVQLAHIGLPIVGDVKYGGRRHTDKRAICLHSHLLEFTHPVTQEKMVVKSIPYQYHWKAYGEMLMRVTD